MITIAMACANDDKNERLHAMMFTRENYQVEIKDTLTGAALKDSGGKTRELNLAVARLRLAFGSAVAAIDDHAKAAESTERSLRAQSWNEWADKALELGAGPMHRGPGTGGVERIPTTADAVAVEEPLGLSPRHHAHSWLLRMARLRARQRSAQLRQRLGLS